MEALRKLWINTSKALYLLLEEFLESYNFAWLGLQKHKILPYLVRILAPNRTLLDNRFSVAEADVLTLLKKKSIGSMTIGKKKAKISLVTVDGQQQACSLRLNNFTFQQVLSNW